MPISAKFQLSSYSSERKTLPKYGEFAICDQICRRGWVAPRLKDKLAFENENRLFVANCSYSLTPKWAVFYFLVWIELIRHVFFIIVGCLGENLIDYHHQNFQSFNGTGVQHYVFSICKDGHTRNLWFQLFLLFFRVKWRIKRVCSFPNLLIFERYLFILKLAFQSQVSYSNWVA